MSLLSYESKQRLKDYFLLVAHEEMAVEKLRQMLASMKEFEPYQAFQRIDRECRGKVQAKALQQFLRENGYREIEVEDCKYLIRYFDQESGLKLNYHDFLQVMVPCEDGFLRAAVT